MVFPDWPGGSVVHWTTRIVFWWESLSQRRENLLELSTSAVEPYYPWTPPQPLCIILEDDENDGDDDDDGDGGHCGDGDVDGNGGGDGENYENDGDGGDGDGDGGGDGDGDGDGI